jgi:hypothetical protein
VEEGGSEIDFVARLRMDWGELKEDGPDRGTTKLYITCSQITGCNSRFNSTPATEQFVSLFAAKDVLHGQTPKRSSILQLPSAVLHFVIDRSLGRSRSVQ